MCILIYSSAKTFGGHEVMSLKGVESLLSHNEKVIFFYNFSNERLKLHISILSKKFNGRMIEVNNFYHTKSLQIVRSWVNLRKILGLVNIIRKFRPHRILVLQGDIEQGSEMIIAAWLLGRICISYIPMIMTGHERKIRFPTTRDFLSRPLYRMVTRFIVISDFFKTAALTLGACDVQVVFNGVDESFFSSPCKRDEFRDRLNVKEDEIVYGYVGRISYQQKGLERLVDLAQLQPGYFSSNRIVILGDGPDLNSLKLLVQKKSLDRCFIFVDWNFQEIPNYMDAIDVLICVSNFEGMPLALLEGLARGCQVISLPLAPLVNDLPASFFKKEATVDEMFSQLVELKLDQTEQRKLNQIFLNKIKRENFELSFLNAVLR